MGEIADMVLDGLLCVQCGVVIDEGAPGHPRTCSRSCARAASTDVIPHVSDTPKMLCPVCGKKIKVAGKADHLRAVHGGPPSAATVIA